MFVHRGDDLRFLQFWRPRAISLENGKGVGPLLPRDQPAPHVIGMALWLPPRMLVLRRGRGSQLLPNEFHPFGGNTIGTSTGGPFALLALLGPADGEEATGGPIRSGAF